MKTSPNESCSVREERLGNLLGLLKRRGIVAPAFEIMVALRVCAGGPIEADYYA